MKIRDTSFDKKLLKKVLDRWENEGGRLVVEQSASSKKNEPSEILVHEEGRQSSPMVRSGELE